MKAIAAVIGVAVLSGCGRARVPVSTAANTAAVERGTLTDSVAQTGILTFRARPDGSPFTVINQASGTYTDLPEPGDAIGCGHVLYRVDNRPVLLLCGAIPAYRGLRTGDRGPDVRQLNRNLHVAGNAFTAKTTAALKTSELAFGKAVFLPEPARIADVSGVLGGPARPGTPVLRATSDVPEVRVGLDPAQRQDVQPGDRARVTLPDNAVATGRVEWLGRVASKGTIPAFIGLDGTARGVDQAPVQVDITTRGVMDALNVPVTAIVGAPGGFAVEVVRGERHTLVAVKLGLFDAGGGRVQVEGELAPGDRVVVPSP